MHPDIILAGAADSIAAAQLLCLLPVDLMIRVAELHQLHNPHGTWVVREPIRPVFTAMRAPSSMG